MPGFCISSPNFHVIRKLPKVTVCQLFIKECSLRKSAVNSRVCADRDLWCFISAIASEVELMKCGFQRCTSSRSYIAIHPVTMPHFSLNDQSILSTLLCRCRSRSLRTSQNFVRICHEYFQR